MNQPKAANSTGIVDLHDSGKNHNDRRGYRGLWQGYNVGIPFEEENFIFSVDEEVTVNYAVPCEIIVFDGTARVTRLDSKNVNYSGFIENGLISLIEK